MACRHSCLVDWYGASLHQTRGKTRHKTEVVESLDQSLRLGVGKFRLHKKSPDCSKTLTSFPKIPNFCATVRVPRIRGRSLEANRGSLRAFIRLPLYYYSLRNASLPLEPACLWLKRRACYLLEEAAFFVCHSGETSTNHPPSSQAIRSVFNIPFTFLFDPGVTLVRHRHARF